MSLKRHMDWLKMNSETSMGKCLIRLEQYFPKTSVFILHRYAGYIICGYRFMQGQDLPALKWTQDPRAPVASKEKNQEGLLDCDSWERPAEE